MSPRHPVRLCSRLVLVIALYTVFGDSFAAGTFYADYSVTDPQCLCGTTNTACGTQTKPYKCIADAYNRNATPPYTVIAKNGTYSECLNLNKSGTNASKLITVRAMNSRLATLSCTNPVPTVSWSANWVTVSGFKIAGQAGYEGVRFTNSTTATQIVNQLLDVEVYGSADGVVVDGKRNAIRDSLVRNCVETGIVVGPGATSTAANTEVTRVESRFNGKNGLRLAAGAQSCLIDSLNAHDNQGTEPEGGVWVETGATSNTFTNTTASNNAGHGLWIVGPNNTFTGGTVAYNASHGVRIDGQNVSLGTDTSAGPDVHHNAIDGIQINGAKAFIINTHVHHNTGQGITGGVNVLIKKCEIDNNGFSTRYVHGIYLGGGPGTISDCRIHHNAAYGIHLYPAPFDIIVERNDIYGNGTLSRANYCEWGCSPYGEYTGGFPTGAGGGIIVAQDVSGKNVNVRYNRIHHNSGGVYYRGCNTAPDMGGNVFHHNTIYENRGGQIGFAYADPGSVKFLSNIVVNPKRPSPDPEPDREVLLVDAQADVTLGVDAFDGNLFYSNDPGAGADTRLFNWNNSVPPGQQNVYRYTFNEWRTTSLPMVSSASCPTNGPASLMDQHSTWATNLLLVDPTMNRWDTGQDAVHAGNYHLRIGSNGITGGVCCAVSNNGLDIDGETPATCTPNPACDTAGTGIGADYYRDTDGDGTANRYDCNPNSSGNSNVCDGDSSSQSQEATCLAAYPGAIYDPAVYPTATEICDGKDNNCSGGPEPDVDLDGYFPTTPLCSTGLYDCDDARPRVYPNAQQFCDGLNNDCLTPGYNVALEADADYDNWRLCENDCNDASCAANPGWTEVCNGVDDNCTGGIDEGCQCYAANACCLSNSVCCSGICTNRSCN